jgi:hypothetical protein
MIHDTIGKLRERLDDAGALNDQQRAELATLLNTLQSEVHQLASTHTEQARSIAGFAPVSTHEAMRQPQDERLLHHAIEGLRPSVVGFEESHPRLVVVVNRVCTALASLGI